MRIEKQVKVPLGNCRAMGVACKAPCEDSPPPTLPSPQSRNLSTGRGLRATQPRSRGHTGWDLPGVMLLIGDRAGFRTQVSGPLPCSLKAFPFLCSHQRLGLSGLTGVPLGEKGSVGHSGLQELRFKLTLRIPALTAVSSTGMVTTVFPRSGFSGEP